MAHSGPAQNDPIADREKIDILRIMQSRPALAIAVLLAFSPLSSAGAEDDVADIGSAPRSVCDLKNDASRHQHRSRSVSLTALAHYDFEYGYFLSSVGCVDSVDGTGVLQIDLPPGRQSDDYPELQKLTSQSWLAGAVGKKVYCTCTGQVTFHHGAVAFTLTDAQKIWASAD